MTSAGYGYHGLGYIGLRGRDLAAWRRFGSDMLGLQFNADLSTETELRFKADSRTWRIAVTAADDDGLDYLGFEVAALADLDRLAANVEAAGVSVRPLTEAEAADRQVRAGVTFTDPAGLQVELFYAQADDRGFQSDAGVSGFVTQPGGLGHVAVTVHDLDAVHELYVERLGFKVSDYAQVGRSRSAFLRCSEREHNLAFVEVRPESRAPRIHHFMLQAAQISDVGCAHDRAEELGFPITVSLGQHTNDEMLSFYCRTPGGFEAEFGTGGVLLAPDQPARTVTNGNIWGHKRAPV